MLLLVHPVEVIPQSSQQQFLEVLRPVSLWFCLKCSTEITCSLIILIRYSFLKSIMKYLNLFIYFYYLHSSKMMIFFPFCLRFHLSIHFQITDLEFCIYHYWQTFIQLFPNAFHFLKKNGTNILCYNAMWRKETEIWLPRLSCWLRLLLPYRHSEKSF